MHVESNNGRGFRFPDFDAYRAAYASGKVIASRAVRSLAAG